MYLNALMRRHFHRRPLNENADQETPYAMVLLGKYTHFYEILCISLCSSNPIEYIYIEGSRS